MALLKTFVPADEDYRNFLRPAIYDSVRRVLKFYGLESSTQIIYNGESDVTKLVGSNSTDPYRTDNYTDGVYRNKLYVIPEFEETPFNNGYANQRREITERPVWMDDACEPMMIVPELSGKRIIVRLVAGFNSDRLAKDFRKRIEIQQAQQMADLIFSATVHMGFNPSVVELLEHVHTLTVKNNPGTPGLGEWFNKRCQVPVTTIMNPAGNHKRLVVPVQLNEIGIQFMEPTIAQARKASTLGKYEVELSYAFYLPEFTGWHLEYPLNIYQDEIDAKWIPRVQDMYKQKFSVRVNPETAFIRPFTANRRQQSPYFLKLPDHDPWVMPKQYWVQPIIQARLAVDDVDDQELFNVFEIPGFKWNERVKQYMLRRHKYAFSQFNTPFLIRVFSNNMQVYPEQLTMDANGSVRLTRRPTIENTYRAVVTLDFAIRDYTLDFWDDLESNPADWEIMPTIFSWYDWEKLERPWSQHVNQIVREIDKGRGLPADRFNNYMMELGLNAHLLLEVQRNAPRY